MKKIVALFSLLVVLTACGGGGRPSTDDIAKALKDSDKAAASDLAGGEDNGLGDDAIVDGDEDYKPSKDDAKVAEDKDFIAALTKCFAG